MIHSEFKAEGHCVPIHPHFKCLMLLAGKRKIGVPNWLICSWFPTIADVFGYSWYFLISICVSSLSLASFNFVLATCLKRGLQRQLNVHSSSCLSHSVSLFSSLFTFFFYMFLVFMLCALLNMALCEFNMVFFTRYFSSVSL